MARGKGSQKGPPSSGVDLHLCVCEFQNRDDTEQRRSSGRVPGGARLHDNVSKGFVMKTLAVNGSMRVPFRL